MEIEVKGHSGCQVQIINDNDSLYIEKSTFDKKYINRLQLQADKQISASKKQYQHMRIPSIYSVDKTSEYLKIRMEYVYSKNFIEHFEHAGFEQIEYLSKALCMFIDNELQDSPVEDIDVKIFTEKFISVKKVIKSNKELERFNEINEIIEKTEIIFNDIKTLRLPIGICHGDLTFSNILFNGNNYYLIDFLDSFIETPLMDIVKVRQDSRYMWSQLMYTKPYDKIRLKLISDKIDNEIEAHFKKYDWYIAYYKQFQLMNMLRVLQYVNEEKTTEYLIAILEDIIHEF